MSATKLNEVSKTLKATQDLHIRQGTPGRDQDNKKGLIYAGFNVQVTEEWRGEAIEGNDRWYRDKNGDFLWSGGFEKEAQDMLQTISGEDLDTDNCAKNRVVDYSLEISKALDYDFGDHTSEDVTVAVLDTGINEQHQDLSYLFTNTMFPSKNFLQSEPDYLDQKGHGTHICGLIAANAEFDVGVRGVAPHCRVWNLKVADKNGNTSVSALKAALEFLAETDKHVDIINMSINTHPTTLDELDRYFRTLHRKGMLMVGAANFNDDQLTTRALTPAASEYVISVGSYTEQFSLENTGLHETLDFMLPNMECCSTTTKQDGLFNKLAGSSMNTALVTGILAKLIAKLGKVGHEKIFRELSSLAKPARSPIAFSKFNLIKNEKSSCHTRYHS